MLTRNLEDRTELNPSIDIPRSTFDLSSGHKTSFNVGEVIPFWWTEVLPGDTFKVTTSMVTRLQTLLTPVMDNIDLDTYWFYVPYRILWSHWQQFMGESNQAWTPSVDYEIPTIIQPTTSGHAYWDVGTIADYLGVPTGVKIGQSSPAADGTGKGISALPFRAYAHIIDQWFRDQNHQDPLVIADGDATVVGSNGSNYTTDVALGGKPWIASRFHDVFSSALPAPQKGTSPVVQTVAQQAQVYTASTHQHTNSNPLVVQVGTGSPTYAKFGPVVSDYDSGTLKFVSVLGPGDNANWTGSTVLSDVRFRNLYADVQASNIFDINEMRLAFQLQKFLERDARGGTRYREMIKSHFGVNVPDSRVQIPEYLGGTRVPLSIHQVANTAQSSGADLGDVGAMSNTSNVHDDFTRSFSEFGLLMGVCVCRYRHSYPQGLERAWTRRARTDFYFPVFANIGEQPVRTREIYLSDSTSGTGTYTGGATDSTVWGYQEAWYEYRAKQSRVSSEMRPGIANSLSSWHLSDYYTQRPTLSSSWLQEDKGIVDRVLAVSSSVSNQVFADFYVKCEATRPMPAYSIPGLIDHH